MGFSSKNEFLRMGPSIAQFYTILSCDAKRKIDREVIGHILSIRAAQPVTPGATCGRSTNLSHL